VLEVLAVTCLRCRCPQSVTQGLAPKTCALCLSWCEIEVEPKKGRRR